MRYHHRPDCPLFDAAPLADEFEDALDRLEGYIDVARLVIRGLSGRRLQGRDKLAVRPYRQSETQNSNRNGTKRLPAGRPKVLPPGWGGTL